MLDEPSVIAGRYELLRQLGAGGMGTVFLARDKLLRREVAVKRLHAGAGTDAARRIEREAKLGAGLTHPALVTVFDTIVEGGSLVIVMEHVDGQTLAQRLSAGRLSPAEALDVLRPVAAALDHAHAHGIVHRDVKPANVLLGDRGTVKLADLGVALSDDVSRITREDAVIGSLPYMAPEQLEPGRVTAAADVFALAAIAFEALSGQRARSGSTPAELARAATAQAVPDLRQAAPDVPAAAAAVVAAGMAREPERRPRSAAMFVQELETALAPTPTPAPAPDPTPPPTVPISRPAPAPERRRRPAALLGLLAPAAVAVALAVVVLGGGEDEPAPERAAAPEPTATAATSEAPTDTAAAATDASSPEGAVRAFYESAAAGDLDAAWALAGPGMRAAHDDSLETFEGTLGSLESIRFRSLTAGPEGPDGTPVTVETVARHTDRTDRCSGDLLAVPDGEGGYLVDPAGVSCTSS